MRIISHYIYKKILGHFIFSFLCVLAFFFFIDTLYRSDVFSVEYLLYKLLNDCITRFFFISFMSFSITIASVIISLQKKQEILGFYAIGFSAKDLIQPFYVFALFLTFCTYTEAEYAAKYWVKKEDTMHSVGHAFLPDDSRMIFQKSAEGLHDIFWIRSSREVWHLDSLQLSASDALGKNVTQFKKKHLFLKKQIILTKYHFRLIFRKLPLMQTIQQMGASFLCCKLSRCSSKSPFQISPSIQPLFTIS